MGSLLRHIPLLAQAWQVPLWVCEMKDAYLNVPQPADEPWWWKPSAAVAERHGGKTKRALVADRDGSRSGLRENTRGQLASSGVNCTHRKAA